MFNQQRNECEKIDLNKIYANHKIDFHCIITKTDTETSYRFPDEDPGGFPEPKRTIIAEAICNIFAESSDTCPGIYLIEHYIVVNGMILDRLDMSRRETDDGDSELIAALDLRPDINRIFAIMRNCNQFTSISKNSDFDGDTWPIG